MILSGSYRHSTYHVDTSTDASASLVVRKYKNGTLSPEERRPGKRLVLLNRHLHRDGNVYFLTPDAIHTVDAIDTIQAGSKLCEDGRATPPRIVTLFVKDLLSSDTFFYGDANGAKLPEVAHEPVEGDEKRAVLDEIERHIRSGIHPQQAS